MADIVSKEIRSQMMRGIRAKNTKPEIIVRKALHAEGYRFRLHARHLPGNPDIVLPKHKLVIFVHGCFWHGHDCKYFRWPKSNAKWWKDKIFGNQERDKNSTWALQALGWRIGIVWECALIGKIARRNEPAVKRVCNWPTSRRKYLELRGRQ